LASTPRAATTIQPDPSLQSSTVCENSMLSLAAGSSGSSVIAWSDAMQLDFIQSRQSENYHLADREAVREARGARHHDHSAITGRHGDVSSEQLLARLASLVDAARDPADAEVLANAARQLAERAVAKFAKSVDLRECGQ